MCDLKWSKQTSKYLKLCKKSNFLKSYQAYLDIDVDLQKSVDKSNLLSSKPVSSSPPDSCSHLIHVLLDTFSTGELLGQLKIRTILSSSKEFNTKDWPSIFHRKKSNDLAPYI